MTTCTCITVLFGCLPTYLYPAEKKTAIGVVEGNLDEAGELVSEIL